MKPCAPCNLRLRLGRGAKRGFTLPELCAVIAIVGLLAAFALPAYNNYAVKSRFAEVVLATAPTKSAISVCAAAGDCLAGAGSEARVNLEISPVSTQTCGQTSAPSATCVAQATQTATLAAAQTAAAAPRPTVSSRSLVATANAATAAASTAATNAAVAAAVAQCPLTSQQTCSTTTSARLAFLPCVGGGNCAPPTPFVSSVSYDANGVITAQAASGVSGLRGETFVLTPSISNGRLDWSVSGTCKTRAGGALC